MSPINFWMIAFKMLKPMKQPKIILGGALISTKELVIHSNRWTWIFLRAIPGWRPSNT